MIVCLMNSFTRNQTIIVSNENKEKYRMACTIGELSQVLFSIADKEQENKIFIKHGKEYIEYLKYDIQQYEQQKYSKASIELIPI